MEVSLVVIIYLGSISIRYIIRKINYCCISVKSSICCSFKITRTNCTVGIVVMTDLPINNLRQIIFVLRILITPVNLYFPAIKCYINNIHINSKCHFNGKVSSLPVYVDFFTIIGISPFQPTTGFIYCQKCRANKDQPNILWSRSTDGTAFCHLQYGIYR